MADVREERVAAAKARMLELGTKFIERSRGELATMRAGLARLRAGDAAALSEIRHFAHKMAGTGATLGFDAFGQRAARLEALIDAQPAGRVPDAEVQEKLAAHVAALESQLAADADARGAGPAPPAG
ncbi:MAG TPA: Hpt domain-containing protein [Steroidobacteraceae bacterium]|nr:Hpt domain-containing protein [Steroidobacteraceae bacterium]